MIPSINQLMSGLSFAFSLLRGYPFDLVKSQVNVGPLGLWHVLFITTIISIVSILLGIILIVLYYSFSANLKSLYLRK